MAAYAGTVEIECDGCGKRLLESSEVYCLGCRSGLRPETVKALGEVRDILLAMRSECGDIRVALDVVVDSGLIAPVSIRDQLKAISDRLGRLIG